MARRIATLLPQISLRELRPCLPAYAMPLGSTTNERIAM